MKKITAGLAILSLVISCFGGYSVYAGNEAVSDIRLGDASPTEDAGIAGGVYIISSGLDSSKVLGITESSYDSGAALSIQDADGSSGEKFVVTPLGSGLYSIVSAHSGKSLDITGGSTDSGTKVQQYQRNQTAAQKFYIRKDVSGLCTITPSAGSCVFDVPGADTSAGNPMQIYEFNGTSAQYFSFRAASAEKLTSGTYFIHTSYADGKVIDIADGSPSSGGNAEIYQANGTGAQMYTLTAHEDGSFQISPVCSSLALDVSGGIAGDGSNIQQYTPNNTAAQKWNAIPTEDGYYILSSALSSGYCMDVSGGSYEDRANVQLYGRNDSAAQKFSFEMVDPLRMLPDSAAFMIASGLDSSKAVDVANASRENGANVRLWDANASAAQKFVTAYKGNGFYTLQCACSAKMLDVAGGSSDSGANVQQYDGNGSAAQMWRFFYDGSGKYTIRSALGTVLDAAGGSSESGTNIQAYASNGTAAQKFSLIPTTASVYTAPAASGHLIAIDPGHQLHADTGLEPIAPGSSTLKQKVSSGTYGPWSGLNEYQLNLDVSLKLRDELQSRGYQVYMIRTSNDVDISNAERAQMAAAAGADIFIRIHANSVDSSSVSGALCYQPSSGNPYLSSSVIAGSQRLSKILVNSECAATGLRNRGLLDGDDMTGINWASMPVSIVEMGFMSSQSDDLYMASSSGQAAIVQGLANGVDAYFNS
jgi:N-acetylmuramoyl-L-alanine amidase